jgi:hypothetical protein
VPTCANLEEERAIDLVLLGSEDGGQVLRHSTLVSFSRSGKFVLPILFHPILPAVTEFVQFLSHGFNQS